mgnify:CR=1 FL=1
MNKVQLTGRMVNDPTLRYTKQNTPVASYTIAINTGYGEKQQTDFINVTTWGKSGEFVHKYFKKGQAIALVGRLRSNNYEDRNGNKRYTVEVITEDIEFVGSKKQDDPVPEETQFPDNYKSEYQNNIILNDDFLPF